MSRRWGTRGCQSCGEDYCNNQPFPRRPFPAIADLLTPARYLQAGISQIWCIFSRSRVWRACRGLWRGDSAKSVECDVAGGATSAAPLSARSVSTRQARPSTKTATTYVSSGRQHCGRVVPVGRLAVMKRGRVCPHSRVRESVTDPRLLVDWQWHTGATALVGRQRRLHVRRGAADGDDYQRSVHGVSGAAGVGRLHKNACGCREPCRAPPSLTQSR